ncbi:hypothetical protein AX17_001616 [Amanita inopinata Kibby_2008]|nr:hypothetical protein AX17_001616 [Amanita inopinata Kibby_2008]
MQSHVRVVNKGIVGMPAPGNPRAPHFDSKYPEELRDFLKEFDEYAEACGLTTQDKARVVVRYTDAETKRFWKCLEGYDENFEMLKGKILKSYSKSRLGEAFTRNQLAKLISRSADGEIDDEGDLYAYYREFWPVASYLVDNKKISKEDLDRYFWKGLPSRARKAIRNRLETRDHTFDRSQVPTVQMAMEAGRFVFSKEAVDDDAFIEEALRRERRKKGKGRRNLIDDEEDEESSEEDGGREEGKSEEDEAVELALKLCNLNREDAAYASIYARLVMGAPVLVKNILPPTRWTTGTMSTTTAGMVTQQPFANNAPFHRFARRADPSCHFCKQVNCRLRTCPVAADYIRLGRVIRHPNGYHTHADGTRIGWHPGGLRAAVDLKMGPVPVSFPGAQIPTATRTFVAASDVEEEEESVILPGSPLPVALVL